MGEMGCLSTNDLIIPLGQIISFTFLSTICFFLRRYKLGLMVSFAFVFNWGFLHGSANFVDGIGRPTMELFLYLVSGLMMTTLIMFGFFRKE